MSSEDTNTIDKEKLDVYLKELAKEYRRMGGKAMPAELIFNWRGCYNCQLRF